MRKTTDWRAVCGRTACTVRRAGRTSVLPDPYPFAVIGAQAVHAGMSVFGGRGSRVLDGGGEGALLVVEYVDRVVLGDTRVTLLQATDALKHLVVALHRTLLAEPKV